MRKISLIALVLCLALMVAGAACAATTVTGTVTRDGSPVSGVTVIAYSQTTTANFASAATGADGVYTIADVTDSENYILSVKIPSAAFKDGITNYGAMSFTADGTTITKDITLGSVEPIVNIGNSGLTEGADASAITNNGYPGGSFVYSNTTNGLQPMVQTVGGVLAYKFMGGGAYPERPNSTWRYGATNSDASVNMRVFQGMVPDGTTANQASYTVSAWVYKAATNANQAWLNLAPWQNGCVFLYGNDGPAVDHWNGGNFGWGGACPKPTFGAWHHFVIVNNGTSETYYVDNTATTMTRTATFNYTNAASNNPMLLGNCSGDDSYQRDMSFDGGIAQLKVWNTAASATDVAALFSSEFPNGILLRTITGKVVQYDGTTPVSGATVKVMDSTNAVLATTTTAEDGTYSISVVLTDGIYSVLANKLLYMAASAVTVDVPNGQANITAPDINMDPYGIQEVTGTVLRGETPVVGATVTAYCPDDKVVSNSSVTAEDGSYKVSVIPGNKYTIGVKDSSLAFGEGIINYTDMTFMADVTPKSLEINIGQVGPIISIDASSLADPIDPTRIINNAYTGGAFVYTDVSGAPVAATVNGVQAIQLGGVAGSKWEDLFEDTVYGYGPWSSAVSLNMFQGMIPDGTATNKASYTVSAWVYKAASSDRQVWLTLAPWTNGNLFFYGQDGVAIDKWNSTGGWNFGWGEIPGGKPAFGCWHHFVIINDGNGETYYVDTLASKKTKTGTFNYTNATGDYPAVLGNNYGDDQYARNMPFDGAIYKLEVWNAAASSTMVSEMLNSTLPGTCIVKGQVNVIDGFSSDVRVTITTADNTVVASTVTDTNGAYEMVAVPIGATYTVTGSKATCSDVVNPVTIDLTTAVESSVNTVPDTIVLQQEKVTPVYSFNAADAEYVVDQKPTTMPNKGVVPNVTDATYFVNENGILPTVKMAGGLKAFDFSDVAKGLVPRRGTDTTGAELGVSAIPGLGNDPSPIAFTISAWLYRDNFNDTADGQPNVSWLNWGSWGSFIDCHYGSTEMWSHGYGWFVDLYGDGVSYNSIGGSPATGAWHNIVFVQNQSANKFDCYIDGDLKATAASMRSIPNWANRLTIGSGWYSRKPNVDQTQNAGSFGGYFNKFELYNVPLMGKNLNALLNELPTGFCNITGSVVMNGPGGPQGVKVELYDGANLVATTGSDTSGKYMFKYMTAGKLYTLKLSKPFCTSDKNDVTVDAVESTVYTADTVTFTQAEVGPAIVLDASKVSNAASIVNTGSAGGYLVAATAPAITKIPDAVYTIGVRALNYAGTPGSYLRAGATTDTAAISPSAIPALGADAANATFTVSAWLYRVDGGQGNDISWLRWGRQWTGVSDPCNALFMANYGADNGGGAYGWGWAVDLWDAGSGISYSAIAGPPAYGAWHHIVIVQDKYNGSGKIEYFVDKVSKATASGLQRSTGGGDMLFGSGNSGALNGGIAKIVIYPAALSGQALTDLNNEVLTEATAIPVANIDELKNNVNNDVLVNGTVTVVSKSNDCFFIADKNDYKGCVMVKLGGQAMPTSAYLNNLQGTVSKDVHGQYTLTLTAAPADATSGPAITAVGMNNRSALTDAKAVTNLVKVWGTVAGGTITDGYSSPITLIDAPADATGVAVTGVLWKTDTSVVLYCNN